MAHIEHPPAYLRQPPQPRHTPLRWRSSDAGPVVLPHPPHHAVVFDQWTEDFADRLVTRCRYETDSGRRFTSKERRLMRGMMLASEYRDARHQEAIAAYRDLREEVRLFNLATQPYSRQWEAK